ATVVICFFFQAEDGIRDKLVTGVQTCALPISGFLGSTNSDLSFTGKYAIQGNYNGPVIWDMTNPASPVLVTAYNCPASQNDVSEIGRASCRERVARWTGSGAVGKRTEQC